MHVTKYTRGTLGHMLGHYDRTKDGLGENVVPERTQLNCDTPTRVLANGRSFLRHDRTPQRAITSPLHPVTSLPLSRLFCGCLF